jgi:FkbM family methyltransferase
LGPSLSRRRRFHPISLNDKLPNPQLYKFETQNRFEIDKRSYQDSDARKVKKFLGYPRIWWPPLRNSRREVTTSNIQNIICFAWTIFLVKSRLRGARPCTLSDQKKVLKLNRNTDLGLKNEIINIEPDDVIYKSVNLSGEWGKSESVFLAGLCGKKTTLLDLGANIGLISKQILNVTKNISKVLVVEPRSATMLNLRMNLQEISKARSLEIVFCQFALSEANGESNLYTETSNIGNSSLRMELAPNSLHEKVQTVTSETFYRNYLSSFLF